MALAAALKLRRASRQHFFLQRFSGRNIKNTMVLILPRPRRARAWFEFLLFIINRR
jgi:hypothetical protein